MFKSATRKVNGYQIYAEYTGGIYIDLKWGKYACESFDVINVYDYRKGEIKEFNISQELTEWIKANRHDIAHRYRSTIFA